MSALRHLEYAPETMWTVRDEETDKGFLVTGTAWSFSGSEKTEFNGSVSRAGEIDLRSGSWGRLTEDGVDPFFGL